MFLVCLWFTASKQHYKLSYLLKKYLEFYYKSTDPVLDMYCGDALSLAFCI